MQDLVDDFYETMKNPNDNKLKSFRIHLQDFTNNFEQVQTIYPLYPGFIFYACDSTKYKEMFETGPNRTTINLQQLDEWESKIVEPTQAKRMRPSTAGLSQDTKKLETRLIERLSPNDFCPVSIQNTTTNTWANSIQTLLIAIKKMVDIFGNEKDDSFLLYSQFSDAMAWINGSNLGVQTEFTFYQGWVCYLHYIYHQCQEALDKLIGHSLDLEKGEECGSLRLSLIVADMLFKHDDCMIEEMVDSLVIAGANNIKDDHLFILYINSSKHRFINGNNVLWGRFSRLLVKFVPQELFVMKILCNRNGQNRFEKLIGRTFQSKLNKVSLKQKMSMMCTLYQVLKCDSSIDIIQSMYEEKKKKCEENKKECEEKEKECVEKEKQSNADEINEFDFAARFVPSNGNKTNLDEMKTNDVDINTNNNHNTHSNNILIDISMPQVRSYHGKKHNYANQSCFLNRQLKHPHHFHNGFLNSKVITFSKLIPKQKYNNNNCHHNNNNGGDKSTIYFKCTDKLTNYCSTIGVARDCFKTNYTQTTDKYNDGIRHLLEMIALDIVHSKDDISVKDAPRNSKDLVEWLYKLQQRIKASAINDETRTVAGIRAGFDSAVEWYEDVSQAFDSKSKESHLCLDLAVHHIIEDYFLKILQSKQLLSKNGNYWQIKSDMKPEKDDAVYKLFEYLNIFSNKPLTWIPDISNYFSCTSFVNGLYVQWNSDLIENKHTFEINDNLTLGEKELIQVLSDVMKDASRMFESSEYKSNVKVLYFDNKPLVCIVDPPNLKKVKVPKIIPRKFISIAYSMVDLKKCKNIHLVNNYINLPSSSKIMNEALNSGGIVSSMRGDRDFLIQLAKKPGNYRVNVYENGTIKLDCIKLIHEDADHYVLVHQPI